MAAGTDPDPASPAAARRSRIMSSTGWTTLGHGAVQLIRLGSSLVLTRLLVPEVYGLMELVYVFLTALYLFSDVGLGTCIVQSPRGDDPNFLNTAWTIQAIRGVLLTLVSVPIGVGASLFYGQPMLAYLIPGIGLVALIDGFDATSLHTESRRIHLRGVIKLEVALQLGTVFAQVGAAMVWPSVWVLVLGSWVGALIRLVGSHRFLPSIPHRFLLEPEALREIFTFGKWIFGSTALHFVSIQGDRLILARLLEGFADLGVYAIAGRLKMAVQVLQVRLVRAVVFPAFAERYRELASSPHERRRLLARSYDQARLRLDAVFVTAAGVLMVLGSSVIDLLYSAEYAQAGAILEIFSVEVAMSAALTPAETLLFALGMTKYTFFRSFGRAVWIVVAVPLGWHWGGFPGLVWAVALSEVPTLVVVWFGLIRNGYFHPVRELRSVLFFGAGWGLGLGAEALLGTFRALPS
ncbi:MAG: oligosaccharide flippase family protein [Myxococcota bacterium]